MSIDVFSEEQTCGAGSLDIASVPTLPVAGAGDAICERIQAALLGTSSPRGGAERRRERRHAFPYTIAVIPLDRQQNLLRDETFFVIGKHISHGGLDFYYHAPVPHREAIVTLPSGSGRSVALLIDLGWCRFSAHRWYENGGKFLQAVKLPEDHPEATRLAELQGCGQTTLK